MGAAAYQDGIPNNLWGMFRQSWQKSSRPQQRPQANMFAGRYLPQAQGWLSQQAQDMQLPWWQQGFGVNEPNPAAMKLLSDLSIFGDPRPVSTREGMFQKLAMQRMYDSQAMMQAQTGQTPQVM